MGSALLVKGVAKWAKDREGLNSVPLPSKMLSVSGNPLWHRLISQSHDGSPRILSWSPGGGKWEEQAKCHVHLVHMDLALVRGTSPPPNHHYWGSEVDEYEGGTNQCISGGTAGWEINPVQWSWSLTAVEEIPEVAPSVTSSLLEEV